MPFEIGTSENQNLKITINQDTNINKTLRDKENFRIIVNTRRPEAPEYENLHITLLKTETRAPQNDK